MQHLNGEHQQFIAAIRLARLPGVGARHFAELVRRHGNPGAALAARHGEAADLIDPRPKAPMEAEVEKAERYLTTGGEGTYLGGPDYPPSLGRLSEPPPYLFRRGPLWPIEGPAVAIVGSRRASRDGRAVAYELARNLALAGVTIVSGGALGVDTAVHLGALEVGGRVVLVTATGIDGCYPPGNKQLFATIARHGCILTELLPGTPPRRDFFPTRNRIIAGLSDAMVVVEGTRRSGTYSSYAHARKLGRPIFAWTAGRGELGELARWALARGGRPIYNAEPKPILDALAPPRDPA